MLSHRELRNSGENRRKRSEIFFENSPREYKDLILVKKKIKIISCLCTFKGAQVWDFDVLDFNDFFIMKSTLAKCYPGYHMRRIRLQFATVCTVYASKTHNFTRFCYRMRRVR